MWDESLYEPSVHGELLGNETLPHDAQYAPYVHLVLEQIHAVSFTGYVRLSRGAAELISMLIAALGDRIAAGAADIGACNVDGADTMTATDVEVSAFHTLPGDLSPHGTGEIRKALRFYAYPVTAAVTQRPNADGHRARLQFPVAYVGQRHLDHYTASRKHPVLWRFRHHTCQPPAVQRVVRVTLLSAQRAARRVRAAAAGGMLAGTRLPPELWERIFGHLGSHDFPPLFATRSAEAAVALAAVLEYTAAEIVELSGHEAEGGHPSEPLQLDALQHMWADGNAVPPPPPPLPEAGGVGAMVKLVLPQHVRGAIGRDASLRALLAGHHVITDSGVAPGPQAVLSGARLMAAGGAWVHSGGPAAFDASGLLHWLGTAGDEAQYINPSTTGKVTVTASSLGEGASLSQFIDWSGGPGGAGAEGVAGTLIPVYQRGWRQYQSNCTRVHALGRPRAAAGIQDADNPIAHGSEFPWVAVQLPHPLVATRYCLRRGERELRDWVFEGSVDGVDWVVLRGHAGDESLAGLATSPQGPADPADPADPGAPLCREDLATATWEVEAHGLACRHFRVRMTSDHHLGNAQLHMNGLELYGWVPRAAKVTVPLQLSPAAAAVRSRPGAEIPALLRAWLAQMEAARAEAARQIQHERAKRALRCDRAAHGAEQRRDAALRKAESDRNDAIARAHSAFDAQTAQAGAQYRREAEAVGRMRQRLASLPWAVEVGVGLSLHDVEQQVVKWLQAVEHTGGGGGNGNGEAGETNAHEATLPGSQDQELRRLFF